MEHQTVVVLITAPSVDSAREIARSLLEQKLAACANILPGISSLYLWEDALHDDAEALLIVKTRMGLFEERLVPAVQELHPYELPEIIALPVTAGLPAYLEWINQVTEAGEGGER